ncbi:MAG: ATP-binding protein, partial [Candidatus Omnitrophica bacterium]|nr:ATP-binding protein [Candidatus Omnitrophota bacterium]
MVYPADFILVGAMNPCPCGYYLDEHKECSCSPLQIKNYMGKISGPLVDRIDIHLAVDRIRPGDYRPAREPECSAAIRSRVEKARALQAERYRGSGVRTNAQLDGRDVEKYCELTEKARGFLMRAIEELQLSGRAYHKIMKVGRTLADLEAAILVESRHVEEALQYRFLDRDRSE